MILLLLLEDLNNIIIEKLIMNKKVIFIFLLAFILFANVYAETKSEKKYLYVCDNSECLNTTKNSISEDQYYMINTELNSVSNFSDYIEEVLYNNYINYYKYDSIILIEWYCLDSWCENIEDKEFTFEELIKINWEINLWEDFFWWWEDNQIISTYSSWKDYLFTNFSDIINELHEWYPIWDKKDNLSDILENIISYNTGNDKFEVKNVCKDNYDSSTCWNSNKEYIELTNNGAYKFLTWEIKEYINFKNDTFKVSESYNVSDLYLKAWNSLDFDFWFEDYLNFWSDYTEYEYKIYYNYEWKWELWAEDYFLKENIKIDNNDFSITSDNIEQNIIWERIEIEVLNEFSKKIRVWIKEWIILTKAWKVDFYLSVKNITTWDSFDIALVNNEKTPVEIFPNDNISKWYSEIINEDAFEWLSDENYLIYKIFVKLEDKYNNIHYDYIDGYDISISDWSSKNIKLAEYWSDEYSDSLQSIESRDYNWENVLIFYFKVTWSWYHDFKGFDIKVKQKENKDLYLNPIEYSYMNNIVPKSLYDENWQLIQIYIEQPLISELELECWNSVSLSYFCSSDNFSWCDSNKNTSKLYKNFSDNWKISYLTLKDLAGNINVYKYFINHIDSIAPSIDIYKNDNLLELSEYSYKANSDLLKIIFNEVTPSKCNSQINYTIKINDEIKESWNLDNTWEFNIDIDNLFNSTWEFVLEVNVTDKYWNENTKTLNFIIYPNDLDSNNTLIFTSQKDSKYANHDDYYEYIIELKDKYWNVIYDKEIDELNLNCKSYDDCSYITNNMYYNNWDDSIWIEYDSLESDEEWKIYFNIKSFAPWIFSELFEIKLNSWDNNYIDLLEDDIYEIWSINNYNSFKKPFTWKLFVSDNTGSIDFDSLPVLWTMQKYKLGLFENTDITYASWNINIIWNNTIKNTVDWHIFKDFTNVKNIFWSGTDLYLWFTSKIDVTNSGVVLTSPNIITDDLLINYNLEGENITYVLTENDDFKNTVNIELWLKGKLEERLKEELEEKIKKELEEKYKKELILKKEFEDEKIDYNIISWLRIIWILHWPWNTEITWQVKKITDLSKIDYRAEIRKNAYLLIKNKKSWEITNWVKYVEWDISISWNITDYETLIVKNWNVIITWDLNTAWNKLWIIILKDWYNVINDYKDSWNIYVNSNVSYVDAMIYWDWWFISSDTKWSPYTEDSIERTSDLQEQLVLKWALFTRNTIWWAMLSWWYYLLPGWAKTTDYNNAMIYDLNYLKTWNNWWDWDDENDDWNNYNEWYDDPFIIKYNSNIQIDLPVWFDD